MKKLFLILLVLHISSTITAQWVTQNSGTLKNLASVYFVNANSGYAVGYDGTIIKTIDGGTNWLTLNSGSTELLSSVHFPSINKGYVVGGKTLLKTTDGGTNWTTQIIDSNYFLSSVFFTNPDTGFIVGASDDPGYFDGIILKTIDGGNIWTISFIYSVHYLQDVFFLSDDIGFVVGSIGGADPTGIILKTNNGGIDWVDISVASPLSSINMLTVDTGYAIGHDYIVIYKTNDGWGNWTSQYWGWQFISINFTSIDVGYALGHGYFGNHSILKTSDGGINWDIQDSTLTYQPTSMFFPSPDTGYIVGTLGTIYKTTNGGANVNNCLPEGIAFTSQSQIDSFQIYYPNCTEIEGDLVISGEYITNLNGLLGLASIGGDLRIHGANALTDLYGLDNISNIGGDLWMAYNDSLKTLNGLGSLTSVQGNLNIGDNNYTGQPWNPSLNSLTGLSNLSYVGGGLRYLGVVH